MTRSSFWLIPLATLAALPARSAVLTNSKTPVNSSFIQAIPALRVNGLGSGLARGAALTAPVSILSLPGVAAPSVFTLSAPNADLALPTPAIAPAVAPVVAAAAPNLSPALTPAPEGTGPGAAASKLIAISQSVAPELKAIAEPSLQGEGSQAAGERVMSAVLDQQVQALPGVELAPAEDGALSAASGSAPSAKGRKTSPLLKKVSYSSEIPAESRSLFQETLSRRKASWIRQLGAVGVKLIGPVEPVLSVRSSKDLLKGEKVEFIVDWTQGETHIGSFKAVVTRKNLNAELRRLPAPEPPKEKQIRVRFKKTTVINVGGIRMESQVSDDYIASYLEKKGLRLLSKGWEGDYLVSVTGADKADAVSREISGTGIVLYATPAAFTAPESEQVQVMFKKTSVSEDEIGGLLAEQGLAVLKLDRDGTYTVGAEGISPLAVARALSQQPGVLYAKPAKFDPSDASQLIIKLRESYIVSTGGLDIENAVSEDDLSALLRRHGLMPVKILNNGAYKVSRISDETPGKDLVAAVSQEPIVKEALALGGVTDEAIKSAASGVASYKGRPWSSTEYNMAYGTTYWNLEERGATAGQLKLFEMLCDEAPVRGGGFNPWSGD